MAGGEAREWGLVHARGGVAVGGGIAGPGGRERGGGVPVGGMDAGWEVARVGGSLVPTPGARLRGSDWGRPMGGRHVPRRRMEARGRLDHTFGVRCRAL